MDTSLNYVGKILQVIVLLYTEQTIAIVLCCLFITCLPMNELSKYAFLSLHASSC